MSLYLTIMPPDLLVRGFGGWGLRWKCRPVSLVWVDGARLGGFRVEDLGEAIFRISRKRSLGCIVQGVS